MSNREYSRRTSYDKHPRKEIFLRKKVVFKERSEQGKTFAEDIAEHDLPLGNPNRIKRTQRSKGT